MMLLPLIVVAGAVSLVVLWIYQFTFMMSLSDAMFSGKCDKCLWCAAFILVPLLTPVAFMMWKKMARAGQA